MGDNKKIAAYICGGCDIGRSLDVEALRTAAAGENKLEICRDHPWLCSAEAVDAIRGDIAGGVQAVVIAACSPRAMGSVFSFDGCQTERVNLREHVVWSHEANNEDTQMLAEDYLRMGIARAREAKVPEPHVEETDTSILVVGGGIGGMTAALDAAKAGYAVTLIEKESKLGGRVAQSARSFPKRPPYRDLVPTGIEDVIAEVEAHKGIRILTSTCIEKIKGQPGQFQVSVKNGNGKE